MMRESVRKFALKSTGAQGQPQSVEEVPAADEPAGEEHLAQAEGKPTIVLSDDDFGKY